MFFHYIMVSFYLKKSELVKKQKKRLGFFNRQDPLQLEIFHRALPLFRNTTVVPLWELTPVDVIFSLLCGWLHWGDRLFSVNTWYEYLVLMHNDRYSTGEEHLGEGRQSCTKKFQEALNSTVKFVLFELYADYFKLKSQIFTQF